MDDLEFKEGFLCPICVKDLGTIAELTSHFDTVHSSEDKDVLQSFKGFIGRAKRKLLKEKDRSKGEDDESGAEQFPRLNWGFQEMGVTQRHTQSFCEIRSLRVGRYLSQTKKLVVRLRKLITDAPTDPEKRKAHEKSVVMWVEDSDVRLCPGCAKPFNLSRRRHHCRLCGGIMCHMCSQFVDFNFARKLINPMSGSPVPTVQRSPLTRRGSLTSLASVVGPSGEPHLRLCRDCLALLHRRDQKIEQETSVPIVVQMYQRMKNFMEEAESLIPQYCKMVDSLQEGQSNYTLEEVQGLRVRLTRIAENVDLISRKIGVLGAQDGGPEGPSPRALQLQGCVRLAASHFLRQNMLGLPVPPSSEELARLQEARREQVQQRLQREKAAAVEAQQRQKQPGQVPANIPKLSLGRTNTVDRNDVPSSSSTPSGDTGWSPANVLVSGESAAAEDPMVQQMNIIRGYIRQARAARRMDEVATLEANLKELKQEYVLMTMNQASQHRE